MDREYSDAKALLAAYAVSYVLSFSSPVHEKNLSSGFPTRSYTNSAVQPQKIAKGLKFRIEGVEGLYYQSSKTKALIICAVTADLLLCFFRIYAKSRFSYDVAHIKQN